jgi:alpha-amylase/alpha-mannosidase (GH57 family)
MAYVCIHGHFYQPPRENPWLEAIELQDSAYPYHDWNERITAECYAPNASARILNDQDRIVRILSNYERISFNFGPTLLSWMEAKSPRVYQAILQADRASQSRFSGHGSAIAQAYSHMIMPLANRRDKTTQVLWGIRDFEFRFGRRPEGMWLPETAVDLETLEILAANDIKFTVLAPGQASREGKIGGRSWQDVSGERIDPSMAYRLNLPSSKRINVFFYDGPISRAVAFESLLASGEKFAQRLMAGFAEELRTWPELVHIASDGETYGHHHRFGEMALAHALDYIQNRNLAQITNYGEFLERHPPIHRVEIFENSSWSCAHGVERWRSNCGCNSGGHSGWSQEWREPLRQALDWLRDAVAPEYEGKAGELLKDPWAARNDYIDVVLDRSPENLARFFSKHAVRDLQQSEQVLALKLLELQRHAMLMYTSCGWFFDELSGIETVQVIQYAGRVVDLAQQVFNHSIEAPFLEKLALAKSNLPEHGDGARIYAKFVKPVAVDLRKVGNHYAIRSMFEPYPDRAQVYCYTVDRQEHSSHQFENINLQVGRMLVTSTITKEAATLSYGALHAGGHNVAAGVLQHTEDEPDSRRFANLVEAFPQSSAVETRRHLEQIFGDLCSLHALLHDEQRRILALLSNSVLAEIEAAHRQVYGRHGDYMRFLNSLGIPLPRSLRASAEFALNSQLREAFCREELNPERIHSLLQESKELNVELDVATLEFTLRGRIGAIAESAVVQSADPALLEHLKRAVKLARSLPFPVNLWWVQNLHHERLAQAYNQLLPQADKGDQQAQAWVTQFAELSDQLSFSLPTGLHQAASPGT